MMLERGTEKQKKKKTVKKETEKLGNPRKELEREKKPKKTGQPAGKINIEYK